MKQETYIFRFMFIIVVIIENEQEEVAKWMADVIKIAENDVRNSIKYDFTLIKIDNNNNLSFTNDSCKAVDWPLFNLTDLYNFLVCKTFESGHGMIIDTTWSNIDWTNLYSQAKLANLPYFKLDITVGPNLRLLDSYILARNASDVAIIFEDMSS